MSQKYAQLRRDYGRNKVDAEAMFFKDKYHRPALRIEVPDMNLEFADGLYVGGDPEGTFYFKEEFRLRADQKNVAGLQSRYTVETIPIDNEPHVVIKLYDPDQEGNPPYAEFVARDPQGLAANSGLLNLHDLDMLDNLHDLDDPTRQVGSWKHQKISRNSAIVEKPAHSAMVTLTSSVIHKKAVLNANGIFNQRWQNERIKVNGRLHTTDTETINSAICARWYQDHIVFYDNDLDATELSGFFFPFERRLEADETSLGTVTDHDKLIENVTWSHV